jgi:hypothetical protein
MMDYGVMQGGAVMWAMGLIGLLAIVALVLPIAAFAKYLFFRWADRHDNEGVVSATPNGATYRETGSCLEG